jgi:hypothetical protein
MLFENQGSVTALCAFNWNMMDSTTATLTTLGTWNTAGKTLAGIRALGWEANGSQHAGAFVDSTRFNFSLTGSGFTAGKGRKIAGINTGLNGLLYDATRGPDVGAVVRVKP